MTFTEIPIGSWFIATEHLKRSSTVAGKYKPDKWLKLGDENIDTLCKFEGHLGITMHPICTINQNSVGVAKPSSNGFTWNAARNDYTVVDEPEL